MIQKYKIMLLIFSFFIFFNMVVKFSIIHDQTNKISILEKSAATARKSSYNKTDPDTFKEQDDIKSVLHAVPEVVLFTEHAVRIRELIDKNQFVLEDSLVFNPEKTEKPDLLKYNTKILVTGDYIKIKHLIADIQNLPGLIYVNTVSMTRVKDDPDRIKLNLELAVFFKRGPV